jgi:hypothetical protein
MLAPCSPKTLPPFMYEVNLCSHAVPVGDLVNQVRHLTGKGKVKTCIFVHSEARARIAA